MLDLETAAREWVDAEILNADMSIGRCDCAYDSFLAGAAFMQKRIEELEAYKKHIYDYVQCTGNTSAKTLGYHVAEALVRDHKDLKQQLTKERQISKMLENSLRNACSCQQRYAGWCSQCYALAEVQKLRGE